MNEGYNVAWVSTTHLDGAMAQPVSRRLWPHHDAALRAPARSARQPGRAACRRHRRHRGEGSDAPCGSAMKTPRLTGSSAATHRPRRCTHSKPASSGSPRTAPARRSCSAPMTTSASHRLSGSATTISGAFSRRRRNQRAYRLRRRGQFRDRLDHGRRHEPVGFHRDGHDARVCRRGPQWRRLRLRRSRGPFVADDTAARLRPGKLRLRRHRPQRRRQQRSRHLLEHDEAGGHDMKAQHIAVALDPVTGIALNMHPKATSLRSMPTPPATRTAAASPACSETASLPSSRQQQRLHRWRRSRRAASSTRAMPVNPDPIIGDLVQNGGGVSGASRRDGRHQWQRQHPWRHPRPMTVWSTGSSPAWATTSSRAAPACGRGWHPRDHRWRRRHRHRGLHWPSAGLLDHPQRRRQLRSHRPAPAENGASNPLNHDGIDNLYNFESIHFLDL